MVAVQRLHGPFLPIPLQHHTRTAMLVHAAHCHVQRVTGLTASPAERGLAMCSPCPKGSECALAPTQMHLSLCTCDVMAAMYRVRLHAEASRVPQQAACAHKIDPGSRAHNL